MYVTKETLANALRDILVETDKGLRAARDTSVFCRLPDAVEIEFEFLIEEGAVDDVTVSVQDEPETETTETRNSPQTVEIRIEERPETVVESQATDTRPRVVSEKKVERDMATTKSTHRPPAMKSSNSLGGADKSEQETKYEYE